MDKPPPPRRPAPSNYQPEYEPNYPRYPQEGVSGSVVNRVFEAYKVNPILTGMILLLLLILGALGYYMMRNDDRIYSYIALRDNRERDLNDRLIEMALKCRDVPSDKSAYPQPAFPDMTTGGKPFKEPPSPGRNK